MSVSDFERAFNMFKPRKAMVIDTQDGAVRVRLMADGSEPLIWYPSLELETPVGDAGVLLQVNSEEYVFVPDNLPLAKTPNIYELRRRMDQVIDEDIPNAVGQAVAAAIDAEPRINDLISAKDRVDALLVDVERFIPAAATRADAWQSAIDTAFAQGGGTVTSSLPGTHSMAAELDLADNVYIDAPAVHLDFSGAATPASGRGTVNGTGSITALPALSATANADSRTLTFSGALPAGVVAGAQLLIYNPANSSFSAHRTSYRNGEFATVLAVSGTTVTLTEALYATHPTTVQMYLVAPIRTGIRARRITGVPTRATARIEYGADVRIEGVTFDGSAVAGLQLTRCYRTTLSGVRVTDYATASGANYGVSVVNCQGVYLDHCVLETARHGFTTGGDDAVGCIPNRDIKATDCLFNGADPAGTSQFGCDLHGNSEHITFDTCTMPNGVQIAGDHITVTNCDIWATTDGRIVFSREMVGADVTMEDNRFHATKNVIANYGFVHLQWYGPVESRTGGVTAVNRNTLYAKGYKAASGATTGIYVYNAATSTLAMDNAVEACGNTVLSTVTADGNQYYSVRVGADTTVNGWRRIAATDNTARLGGVFVENATAEHIDVSCNTVTASPYRGVVVTVAATGYANPVVLLDGGTVNGTYNVGFWITGRQADTTVITRNLTALNTGQSGAAGYANTGGIYIYRAREAVLEACTVGDLQAVPTQSNPTALRDVTTGYLSDITHVGTAGPPILTAVTTTHYRGRGAGVPTLACANGSTYIRTDGAAGSTFYVREAGAWVAK